MGRPKGSKNKNRKPRPIKIHADPKTGRPPCLLNQGKGSMSICCPECGDLYSIVSDNRVNKDATKTRRRRICSNGHRFTTYEMWATPPWTDYAI